MEYRRLDLIMQEASSGPVFLCIPVYYCRESEELFQYIMHYVPSIVFKNFKVAFCFRMKASATNLKSSFALLKGWKF